MGGSYPLVIVLVNVPVLVVSGVWTISRNPFPVVLESRYSKQSEMHPETSLLHNRTT